MLLLLLLCWNYGRTRRCHANINVNVDDGRWFRVRIIFYRTFFVVVVDTFVVVGYISKGTHDSHHDHYDQRQDNAQYYQPKKGCTTTSSSMVIYLLVLGFFRSSTTAFRDHGSIQIQIIVIVIVVPFAIAI